MCIPAVSLPDCFTTPLTLRIIVYTSVFSVPPEAVNMSLGLSLAAATAPLKLLVSCPPQKRVLRGKREEREMLGWEMWRVEGLRWENRKQGQPLTLAPFLRPVAPRCTKTARRTLM